MAVVYAVKSGNWSDTTVWNTGSLPTSADDVYSNNFNVNINQNVSVISIRNTATTGVNAGGTYIVPASTSITIVCDTIVANITLTSNLLVTITANTITSNTGVVIGCDNGNKNLVINGNLYASNTTAITGSNNAGTIVTVNGNVYASTTTANATAISMSNNTVNVIVNGIAQSSPFSVAVFCAANNTVVRVQKAFSPDLSQPAVSQTNRVTTTIVKEIEQGNFGQFPILGYVRFDNAISIVAKVLRENNTQINLVDASNLANQLPAESDVRFGVSYNNNNRTGSCKVPPAASVGVGVPVDNTVGTAALTPQAVWDYATSSLTTAGSIGERLKNASTVDTTGDQLAALL